MKFLVSITLIGSFLSKKIGKSLLASLIESIESSFASIAIDEALQITSSAK